MYKSNFALQDGIKMRLLCFMLKAGEHPEMTVLCVMIVLFSFLNLEGIKIFHTAANLKITGAGKEARSSSSH